MFWGGDESSDQLVVKPITIDVGGTKFHTSRQTICAKSPYFKALVDRGDKITGREIESVFVDRNPKHFMTLLDYMRTGKLLLEGDKASDVVLEELWYVGQTGRTMHTCGWTRRYAGSHLDVHTHRDLLYSMALLGRTADFWD